MSTAEAPTATYIVDLKAYPINITFREEAAASGNLPVDLEIPTLDEPLRFHHRKLHSFAYNDRYTLETSFACDQNDPKAADQLVIQLLPIGSLVTYYIHRLSDDYEPTEVDELRHRGRQCYTWNANHSGLVHDLVNALVEHGMILHSPLAPFDILDPHGLSPATVTRDHFTTEMEWRAWSSANFIKLHPPRVRQAWNWPAEHAYAAAATHRGPHGDFRILFNNYFGWHIERPSEDDTRGDLELITAELEPIAYMISRRSQCASGIHNVKTFSRAFAWDTKARPSTQSMRRYVSAARLAVLAPKEYEESSDKRSRVIYDKACEELDIDRHVREFSEGINLVVDEVRGLQAEHDEQAATRLNRLALLITCVFGFSVVTDVASFLGTKGSMFSLPTRISILLAAGAILLVLLAAIFWSIRLRR